MYQAILVDDEPFVLEGLRHAIDWEGYGFEIALAETNPLKALEYVQQHPVHLLITDVKMPQMDGIELMRQCRELHPQLSVLVISAFDRFDYVRTALKNGAENYLLKPVDPDELAESVGQLAHGIHERDQSAARRVASMLPFQSTFIESWLRDGLTPSELRIRAELLGIDLETGAYTAVIFTSPDDDAQVMSRFYDFLLTLARGKYTVYCLFETKARLSCILSPKPGARGIHSFVEKAVHRARLMGMPVAAVAGETVQAATAVFRSYQSAVSLLFMQYSEAGGALQDTLVLPPACMAQIELNLLQTPQREYLDAVHRLLLASDLPPYALAVLVTRWCLKQHGSDTPDFFQRNPQFVRLSRAFPQKDVTADGAYEYLQEVIRECYKLFTGAKSAMHPCVEAVIAAVHEFSDKNISLKTLAYKLNVSPSYLGNAFKQHTGAYFNDYLTAARLRYAAELIESTDMKMKDIVDKVGFSSQTYFNRTFMRQFALSPVAYRRTKKAAPAGLH